MLSPEQQREPESFEGTAKTRVTKQVLGCKSSVLEFTMQRGSFTNDFKLHTGRTTSSPPTHRFRDRHVTEANHKNRPSEEESTGRWLTWQTYNDDKKLADPATTTDYHHCHSSPTRKVDDDKALFLRGVEELLTLRTCVAIVIVSLMLMVRLRYMAILDELGHLERRYAILVDTQGSTLVSTFDDTINNCLEYFVTGRQQKRQEGIYGQN